MRDELWNTLLPNKYQSGEFLGESLAGEMLRRGSWRALPVGVVERVWKRLLPPQDGLWCFILGVNNSGTSLLQYLIGRHPEVRSLPAEGQLLTRALPRPIEAGAKRLWSTRTDLFRRTERDDGSPAVRALHDWGFQYIRQSGRVLLEKSPPNTIRARWLQANFTRPHFIAMVRHPCAVAEGIRRREGYSVRDAARHWVKANTLLLQDLSHLERLSTLHYEELCSDPLYTLQRLARLLSIPDKWKAQALDGIDVHSLDESVDTVENFNPRSFERLTEEDMKVIAAEAGEVAESFGYRIPPDAG